MATKNTKFKDFQISKDDSKNLKGGYANTGPNIGGTGSTGFIIWDNVDPRDNGFFFAGSSMNSVKATVKKQ